MKKITFVVGRKAYQSAKVTVEYAENDTMTIQDGIDAAYDLADDEWKSDNDYEELGLYGVVKTDESVVYLDERLRRGTINLKDFVFDEKKDD